MMTTQKQVREAFWDFWTNSAHFVGATSTDIRCAFVDYVDSLARDGEISEALAQRVTL